MARKAAVVIGVDKTGDLTTLNSAATGVQRVANWLRSEGFDVECLTDKDGPVESGAVENAIGRFATSPPRYHLLVVYFSGHGYWHARADRWLLSGAPTKTSQAVNLEGAMDLARYSGVPNVVFISDACRAIPESRTALKVEGVDGFPSYEGIDKISKIDVFRATSEARSAYEAAIGGEHQSVLTRALMSAYEEPEPHMVREVVEGTETIKVVPNRRLEEYLQAKVDEILAGIDPNLSQRIEANVPSKDDVYISRIRDPLPPAATTERRTKPNAEADAPSATRIGRDAARSIDATLSRGTHRMRGRRQLPAAAPETEASLERHLPSDDVDHFESEVGFAIRGARVIDVATTAGDGGTTVELLENGDGRTAPAIVRLWHVEPAVSVAIQLEDGRCTILAGIAGYIGHATFDDVGVANVSYVPSSNHWRWGMYERDRRKIDRLRALVALAVEYNTFRIHSDREAAALGSKIRIAKGVDPTLGLYAAHAFSQAGKEDAVVDVLGYMDRDLTARLFDVDLLASRRRGDRTSDLPVVPFCPMLTQTWNLLRPRGIELAEPLQQARADLCDSLWTTFNPTVSNTIMQAVRSGELK